MDSPIIVPFICIKKNENINWDVSPVSLSHLFNCFLFCQSCIFITHTTYEAISFEKLIVKYDFAIVCQRKGQAVAMTATIIFHYLSISSCRKVLWALRLL